MQNSFTLSPSTRRSLGTMGLEQRIHLSPRASLWTVVARVLRPVGPFRYLSSVR